MIGLTAGNLLAFHKVGAQSGSDSLFSNMNPEDVFEISLALENGTVLHHYVYMNEESGVCDVAQPEEQRPCHVDLKALATQFENITVVQFVQFLPESIHWSGPDTTPIVVASEIKAWNAESNQAYRWKVACSVLNDQSALALCARLDRLDHFNYALVAANQLASLVSSES